MSKMSESRKNGRLRKRIEKAEANTSNRNGTGNSSTIPGYILDSASGRYYKDDENSRNLLRNKLATNRKSCGPSIEAKCRNAMMAPNFPSVLLKREQGQSIRATGSSAYPNSVLNLLTKDLKLTATVDVGIRTIHSLGAPYGFPILEYCNELSFVKEGCEAMYAAYHSNTESKLITVGITYILKVPFYHSSDKRQLSLSQTTGMSPMSLSPILSRHYVNDVCEVFDSTEVVGVSKPDFMHRDPSKLVFLEEYNNVMMQSLSPYWCCVSNKQKRIVAVGSQDCIEVCVPRRQDMRLPVKGNVFSLLFNSMGTNLVYGLHSGKLGVFDLRQSESESYKVDNGAINNMAFLSAESSVVCSTLDSKLKLVDLRMFKPVLTYEDHVCDRFNVSTSVSDSHKLMCSTGSDNVTRLWSLYGGKPLLSVKLPSTESRTFSWLKSHGSYCTLYVLQKKMLQYFDICSVIDS